MSKDAWFRIYEKLCDQREAGEIRGTDSELADRASRELPDILGEEADRLKDEMEERLTFPLLKRSK